MILTEIKGDLFKTECAHIVHCISADCAMGAGIARTIESLFRIKRACIEKGPHKIGDVILIQSTNKCILNMVTKNRYFEKPTLKTMSAGLQTLNSMCAAHNIKSLAMPLIGCGLDRLSWNDVRALIKTTLVCVDTVTVYIY